MIIISYSHSPAQQFIISILLVISLGLHEKDSGFGEIFPFFTDIKLHPSCLIALSSSFLFKRKFYKVYW